MKLKTLILAIAATLTLSACTTRIADLTVASSKNYNINSNKFVIGKRVKGQDRDFVRPAMKTAMDKAIEQDECAVGLSNVVINLYESPFYHGYDVEGNLIIDKGLPGCNK